MQEMQERQVRSLSQEKFLEKEMATHTSILAWEMQWTEKTGWLQLQRVRHNLATKQQPLPKGVIDPSQRGQSQLTVSR